MTTPIEVLLDNHNKKIWDLSNEDSVLVLRCIGTTLLTKGLELDTVVILDAHTFDCRKNFYVAITTARKRLIISTNNTILSPYES